MASKVQMPAVATMPRVASFLSRAVESQLLTTPDARETYAGAVQVGRGLR
jgi:hypothetical protein